MKIYRLDELVAYVREHSPFFKTLYARVPQAGAELTDLPILDQADYWDANGLKDNRILTGPQADGIVFKSGGTTGRPKFSIFTKAEWEAFTQTFARGLDRGGLHSGERVANLFYAGDLYASFLFILHSMDRAAHPPVQFPIGGGTSPASILKTVQEFQIDVLAGVPTTLLTLAEFYAANAAQYPGVRPVKVLFGGESMYADQRVRLQQIFPNIKIQSIGCASVDGGPLGYADLGCKPDEHRAFGRETILEIVDEVSDQPITGLGVAGRLVLTNLTRRLMPILRYPAGDRAEWLEPVDAPDRKFRLLGRSEEAARVGPVSVYFEDVRAFLQCHFANVAITQFQLLITHTGSRDRLTLRLVNEGSGTLGEAVRAEFHRERPMFADSVHAGLIHELAVEFITTRDLIANPRTGKLSRIIDRRTG